MNIEITPQQKKSQAGFRKFVQEEVFPHAGKFDREEKLTQGMIEKLARQGFLGALLPKSYGGSQMDWITYGLLCEEMGKGCTSVRSFFMVQNMIGQSILNWGATAHKEKYLPKLISGELIGAFALSEPETGSDAQGIQTAVQKSNGSFILNGSKKWISFGQIADLFLVFGQMNGEIAALLVERKTEGFSIEPITGLTGVRASMLASLEFENCTIPEENLVGQIGFGLAPVALGALDMGRYSISWGCIGMMQACLEACVKFTNQREQFGVPIKDHQLIQQMVTDMIVHTKAARLLCLQAGTLKESQAPNAFLETMIAKYYASTMAVKITSDAVQIHGAKGVIHDNPVERFWRDAKIMEIIEGTTQIHQIKIAEYGSSEYL